MKIVTVNSSNPFACIMLRVFNTFTVISDKA